MIKLASLLDVIFHQRTNGATTIILFDEVINNPNYFLEVLLVRGHTGWRSEGHTTPTIDTSRTGHDFEQIRDVGTMLDSY